MRPPNLSLRLKLHPELARHVQPLASAYGLATATLVAILIWNDTLRPDYALAQVAGPVRLARVPFSCSLRATHRALAARRAREQKLSLNAYLEALIAAQLARGRAPLVVFSSEE